MKQLLFKTADETRIVTTNFDLLFEKAGEKMWANRPPIYSAPALPLGSDFNGIVHVHGALPAHKNLVLTDSDFGRAYLTEGWARRFLVDLFQNFTVLFVGYAYNDPIMQYLARALPPENKWSRFALDKDAKIKEHWKLLGIEQVLFPADKDNDFSKLEEGITKLSDFVGRSILDWKRDIKKIAQNGPPADPEQNDMVKHALKNISTVRYFVENAKTIEWVDWLDSNGLLMPLFEDMPINEIDFQLSWWLTENFAIKFQKNIILLLSKYHFNLNDKLWYNLCHEICIKNNFITIETFDQWLFILLNTYNKKLGYHELTTLVKKAESIGAYSSMINIFDRLTDYNIKISEPLSLYKENNEKNNSYLKVDLNMICDSYDIHELWNKHLKSHLDILATKLLQLVIVKIESRHATLFLWNNVNRMVDSDCSGRSAIEPHEQDRYPKSFDVLIDAARDCMEWIGKNQPTLLYDLCNKLIASDAPLLRRLSIHSLFNDLLLSDDEKISWLLDYGLFEHQLKHEIFMFLKATYPNASTNYKKRILQVITSYTSTNIDYSDEKNRQYTAYIQLNWLSWLHKAAPDCQLVSYQLNIIQKEYPDMKLSEHPDLTPWHSSGSWHVNASPWSVSQLLANPPKKNLDEFIQFTGDDFGGSTRSGLCEEVKNAIKQNQGWGNDLADSLEEGHHWETDLWDAIFRAWADWPASQEQVESIILWMTKDELQEFHTRTIADALLALVKSDKHQYINQIIGRTDQIVKNLWHHVDSSKYDANEIKDWASYAINSEAGIIAEYWLYSLWIRHKNDDTKDMSPLDDEDKLILITLIQDDSIAGGFARTIFARSFAFLFNLDEKWARDNLLSLFSSTDKIIFKQVWDGYIAYGGMNVNVISAFKPSLFYAVNKLDEFINSQRDHFVECYVDALSLYSENQISEWIPKFFKVANENDISKFTEHISSIIKNLDSNDQIKICNEWLFKYWQNRINGIPKPLADNEIELMICWPIKIKSLFHEAVLLAITMKPAELVHSNLCYKINEDDELITNYTDDVIKLLIFFLKCKRKPFSTYNIDKLLIKLSTKPLDHYLCTQLIELLEQDGIDSSALDCK